jgi:hypothetical protein
MRVPDDVIKCIAFIGVTNHATKPGEADQDVFAGTAFLVAVQAKRFDGRFHFLVTANHVADKVEGKNFWVRINKKDGGVAVIQTDGERWIRHPNGPSVDVAVLPFAYHPELDITAIPVSGLLTPEGIRERKTCVGDIVFMVGLFGSAYGKKRNMPIARLGNIAMFPEDKIPTEDLGLIDAYLVEARSFGGLSGSPVFVRETVKIWVKPTEEDIAAGLAKPNERVVIQAPAKFSLLGLAHGHWHVKEDDINAVRPRDAGKSPGVNLGIAVVVPAWQILETLNQPDIVMACSEEEERFLSEGHPGAASDSHQALTPKLRHVDPEFKARMNETGDVPADHLEE